VSGTVTVSGTSADNVGVASVVVAVDNGTPAAAGGTANWTFSLNAASLSAGAHTITATAKDATGNATSASITVMVSNPTPTGTLAQKYPGDVGIENDPAVVYTEKFEESSINSLTARYDDILNPAGLSFSSDVPPGSSGPHSLFMTAIGGQTNGAHLFKNLTNIGKTVTDTLYLRYYVKYKAGFTYHHSSVWFGGYNPPTNWPQGGAGTRPQGNDRISAATEPVEASGRLDNYVYWMGMHSDPNGNYWGNDFLQDPNLTVTTDQWMCVETMLKPNTPVSASNGELAFWINGQRKNYLGQGFPKGHWVWDSFYPTSSDTTSFEGFQWRNDPNLNVNWIWLEHYADQTPVGSQSQMLLDHVVAATQPIGCLTAASDTTPPTISAVASSNITSNGATISWTTNEASDSQVEYGLTTSYGSSSSLNTSLVTSHSTSLSGLLASTLYHYRVK